MFTPDYIIDSVQGANKTFVTTFVKDESIQKELVKLIDSQTKFAKTLSNNTLELATTFYKNVSDVFYPKKSA
jgi:hypothetical protein